MLERLYVCVGDICHVYIVAHTGAVRRIVIVAEDAHRHTIAGGRQHLGNEMGLRVVRFTYLGVRISARGIEVAQSDPAQPTSNRKVLQQTLHEQLGMPVRVDWPLRMVLRNGKAFWYAIDGAARR